MNSGACSKICFLGIVPGNHLLETGSGRYVEKAAFASSSGKSIFLPGDVVGTLSTKDAANFDFGHSIKEVLFLSLSNCIRVDAGPVCPQIFHLIAILLLQIGYNTLHMQDSTGHK